MPTCFRKLILHHWPIHERWKSRQSLNSQRFFKNKDSDELGSRIFCQLSSVYPRRWWITHSSFDTLTCQSKHLKWIQIIQQLKNNVNLNYAHSRQFGAPSTKSIDKNMKVGTIKSWVSLLQWYLQERLEIWQHWKAEFCLLLLFLMSQSLKTPKKKRRINWYNYTFTGWELQWWNFQARAGCTSVSAE